MSMLDRYRKPGGFVQLLALLETCGAAKQEKFLEIIRKEDPRWADHIKTKMIDINRIYSWRDETLAEIVGTLQDLTVATALYAAPETVKARIKAMLTHARRRKIEDLGGIANPSPGEVASTHVKIIETVRKMATDGFIRFEKFDEALTIEDNIEDKLSKAPVAAAPAAQGSAVASDFTIQYDSGAEPAAAEPVAAAPVANEQGNELRVQEISQLKKKNAELSKENAVLRHELSVLKGKLEQIKKIA